KRATRPANRAPTPVDTPPATVPAAPVESAARYGPDRPVGLSRPRLSSLPQRAHSLRATILGRTGPALPGREGRGLGRATTALCRVAPGNRPPPNRPGPDARRAL